jgi:hypothetical protein
MSNTEMMPLTQADVPDAIWPSDNEWGVPTLDLDYQALSLPEPIIKWGAIARKGVMPGTWHFYTDDYKFTALWKNPATVVNTRCSTVVEPNFSTNPAMPRAVVLRGIYRKRWLARYWQSQGIRVFVDLNVEPEFDDLSLLGVPRGWRAYATRWLESYGERDIPTQYERAKQHAGTDILFLVIGGRVDAASMCEYYGWSHLVEHAAIATNWSVPGWTMRMLA